MARQIINVGTQANDGTGDGLRTAYIKCNDNFKELYDTSLEPTQIANGTSNVWVQSEDGNITISHNGTANVAVFSGDLLAISGNITATANITATQTITGNDIVATDQMTVTGTVASNLIPDGNGTRNLGSASARWANIFLTGSTLTLGNIVLKDSGSNTLGIFGSDGTTPAEIDSEALIPTLIASGNSNAKVVAANGDITVNVTGTSNVVVFSTDGITTSQAVVATGNVTGGNIVTAGLASVTGNVTGGNLITAGLVSATGNVSGGNLISAGEMIAAGNVEAGSGAFLKGDGGLISNVTVVSNVAVTQIANGTSVLSIAGADGNITLVSGGTAIGNITSTSANFFQPINNSANITGGNLITGGLASVTGNVTGGNLITGGLASVTGNITGGNLITGGLASVTGNITGGNLITGGLASVTGNITGGNLITAGLASVTGNVTAGNLVTGGQANINFIAVGNVTSNNTITITGNTAAANATTGALIVTGGVGVGNNIFVTGYVNSTGNIVGGNLNTAGLASVTGNVTGGNLNTGGRVVATGNVTGGNLTTGGVVSATGNVTGGNLTTGAQVVATGNVTGGNIITGGVVSATGNITAANFTSSGIGNINEVIASIVKATTLVNATATTAATSTTTGAIRTSGGLGVAGNAHVGGRVVVTGNVVGGNLTTGAQVVATGNVTGGNIITAGVLNVNSGDAAIAIVNGGSNATGNIGSSTKRFNTLHALATSAQYADVAEYYTSDDNYEPGTVLDFGGNKEVTINTESSSNRIAGVVSSNPALIMNTGIDANETSVLVALTGRVPTKVTGSVSKGDMMVADGNGKAMASASPAIGTVIGKALEDFDGDDGVIEVVVGRL